MAATQSKVLLLVVVKYGNIFLKIDAIRRVYFTSFFVLINSDLNLTQTKILILKLFPNLNSNPNLNP